MPDEKRDLFHYTNYFASEAPELGLQSIVLLLMGVFTGVISTAFVHHSILISNFDQLIVYGASSGLLVVSLPAVLAAGMIKLLKTNIKMKHLMFATLVSVLIYSLFIIIASAFFSTFGNATISYVILLLGNASIYSYWLVIGKFIIQRRGGVFIPLIQPTLNILFYIPIDRYILNITLPVSTVLIKLYAGMAIFLVMGYVFLYMVDRPFKKLVNVSGVRVFTIMINQWLYDITPAGSDSMSFGEKKNISVDVLAMRNKAGKYKAIFINPDIHYGPFSGFGGGIATEHIADFIHNKYKTNAIMLHGPVNIAHNPVSSSQVYKLSKNIANYIDSLKSSQFTPASGAIYRGANGPCKAINLNINGMNIITLTKAPLVTEDIHYDVGDYFKRIVLKRNPNSIIIDAHNSRFESASEDELRGVYSGSKYVLMYQNVIKSVMPDGKRMKKLKFGSSQQKISGLLNNPKDMGKGYASFCIFEFGGKRFGMLYFDANNMLPGLRNEIINYVKRKHKMQIEVYTTDTHSVNSIALPSSNVLGRYTTTAKLLPIVDALVNVAQHNLENVNFYNGSFVVKDFRVWGENAERDITKASKEMIRTLKHIAPFVISAGFIIAAWIIYAA